LTIDGADYPPTVAGFRVKDAVLSGDHIYVAHITGQNPIYIRLGNKKNPFLRIFEGDVIQRPYEELTLAIAGSGQPDPYNTQAVVYCSRGPLVIRSRPRTYGAKRFPACKYLLCTTTPQPVTGAHPYDYTFGRNGGSILFKNTDLTNTLYISYDFRSGPGPVNPAGDWPLAPGESFSVLLDSPGEYRGYGFMGYTLAGTATLVTAWTALEVDTLSPDYIEPRGYTNP